MRIILIRYLNCRPKLRWSAIALRRKYFTSYVLNQRNIESTGLNRSSLRHAIIEHASQNRLISISSGKVTIQIPIDRRQLNVRR